MHEMVQVYLIHGMGSRLIQLRCFVENRSREVLYRTGLSLACTGAESLQLFHPDAIA